MKNSNKPAVAQSKTAAPTVRPKIQKILAATDFSDGSLPAVRYALALGGKIGASVTLLHVIELAPSLSGMESVVLASTDAEAGVPVHTQLEALVQREAKSDGKVASVVRTGKPFHEIALAASERAVDLVVIATHGYTGAKRVLLGSTAERVVRHAPCPVLTIPSRAGANRTGKTFPFKLKKILVPNDFSDISKDALPWATFLAAQFGAELVLLHIVEEFPIDYLLGRELANRTVEPLMKQAEAGLAQMAVSLSKSTGMNVSAIVRSGRPPDANPRAARGGRHRCGADRRGRRGSFQRFPICRPHDSLRSGGWGWRRRRAGPVHPT